MKKVEIYVELLDEGTPTLRPTEAEVLDTGLFKLLPTRDYDPEDENWEFKPGSIVRGVKKTNFSREILLAVAP